MQLRLRHVMMKQNEKETIDSVIREFDRSKRAVYEDYVIFTICGRCVFSRAIATNQKQTQQQEETHDMLLVTGYNNK